MDSEVTVDRIRHVMREELLAHSHNHRLAYTLQEASLAVGVSESVLRGQIRHGYLIAKYPSKRPIIEASELQEWLRHLPDEYKPAR